MTDQTEQTALVHNEEETFALEPIDITGDLYNGFPALNVKCKKSGCNT